MSLDTSHVPCKFFKMGNCQAGHSCPFSHVDNPVTDVQPCKYFAKGNCKFGAKCANPHLLPDGRDGRKMQRGGFGGFGYNQRAQPYANMAPQQGYNTMPMPTRSQNAYQSPVTSQDDFFGLPTEQHQYIEPPSMFGGLGYADQYRSPQMEENNMAFSPPARAMDATLPASFDDRDMPALRGAFPSSAPPKRFGFGPVTGTSPTTSMATSNAFGNLSQMASSFAPNGNRNSLLGSSPSTGDGFPRKILHSDLRPPMAMYSSSFQGPFLVAPSPPPDEAESEGRSSDELDCLPGTLDDLLTPKERVRRFSRPAEDSDGRPRSLSGFGSPSFNSPVGSPLGASPSSRYGPLFTKQRENNDLGTSAPKASAYGHVGSPLRKTSFQADMANKPSGISRTRSGNETSMFTSSSPVTRPSGLGMLSQQLRASTLGNGAVASGGYNTSPKQSPNMADSSLAVPNGIGSQRLDRTISTSSMGRSLGDRIDEEETETDDEMFKMEGDGVERRNSQQESNHKPAIQTNGSRKKSDDQDIKDSSEELTPTATGTSSQGTSTLDTEASNPSPPKEQPKAARWPGGTAWNVVAAAGSRIGLTSAPAKSAAVPQEAKPVGKAK
jgi:hypothetical protein